MSNPKLAEEYEKRKRINKDNTKKPEALMKNYIEGRNYQRMDYRESNKDNPNYLIYSGMVNASENSYPCPINSAYNSYRSMIINYGYNQNQDSFIPNYYLNSIGNNYRSQEYSNYDNFLNGSMITNYGCYQNQDRYNLNYYLNSIGINYPSPENSDYNRFLNGSMIINYGCYQNQDRYNFNYDLNSIGNNYPSPKNSDYNRSLNGSMITNYGCYQNQDRYILNYDLNNIGNNYPSQKNSDYNRSLNGSMITNYGCYQNQSNLIHNDCSNSINNINKESNSSLKICDNINSNIVNIDKNVTYEDSSSTDCIAECNIDFVLLVLGKRRLIEPIKIDMEKEVTYDYKKKPSKGKKK